MKTYKNIYSQVIDFDNLMLAWRKARRGKRAKPAAASFEQCLDVEMTALEDELRRDIYQPGAYRSFTIHEPKRRKVSAAPFRDRVVHHALCNVLIPIYERKFIFDSYANRVGKGTHRALDRCTQFMRRYKYVLQCDVQQFFPAVDHEVLKNILTRTIVDRAVLRLCDKIIDSGVGILRDEYQMHYFPGDDLLSAARPRGLPIGNLTSQFWANVYLDQLDQFVKHDLRCPAYVRYVDDFLLFSDDKITLHYWKDQIIQRLQTLRLTLHENRAQPRPIEQGIPFLGFTVYPDHRRLQNRKGLAYRCHLWGLYRAYLRSELPRTNLDASVLAWVGHAQHGDTWGLRTKLFQPIVL